MARSLLHPTTRPAASTASSRALARLMDDVVTIPGTRFGIGLDVVLGLVPGIGDAAGSLISGVILVDAIRNRVPLSVLFLMGWNILVDAVIGFLPVVGTAADAAHRANRKNLRLLERTVAQGRRVHTSTPGYVLRAVLLVVAILAVTIVFSVLALWGLLRLIGWA